MATHFDSNYRSQVDLANHPLPAENIVYSSHSHGYLVRIHLSLMFLDCQQEHLRFNVKLQVYYLSMELDQIILILFLYFFNRLSQF